MKIAILGYDVEGRASYDYFVAQGHELTIRDRNPEVALPEGVASVLGKGYLDDLDGFDLLVRTAGLPPKLILSKNPGVADKITSHTNEFLKACPTVNVIGVTGTKGKGTTSTLITKLLEAAGHSVRLGGNIGRPPLTFLKELNAESWVVLELSSFQLTDLKTSPHIAVCLMVVPEHLNWHADLSEYVEAKLQLFKRQTENDIAIYFAENETSKEIATASPGRQIPYYASPGAIVKHDAISIDGQVICKTPELKLPGRHNWQNVCAAVTAVWQVSQDVNAMRSVLTSFSGLEHRIEFVREIDGVRFYNDSYAAGLHATKAAIEAIDGKKVMILGGFDRMLDIDHFGVYAAGHEADFRKLLIIGASANRLAASLDKAGFTNYTVNTEAKTMPAVVEAARRLASAGDAVVLSPGFASFDMFKNFKERGLLFKEAVQSL
jgi:UDP-N-acetylmuramoylalanine--D-glutamate ligase